MKDIATKKRKFAAAPPAGRSKGKGKAIAPPPPPSDSDSGSGSSSEGEQEDDDERRRIMLQALEAHGRAMFGGDEGVVKRSNLEDSSDDEEEYQSDDGEDMEALARKAQEGSDDDDDDDDSDASEDPTPATKKSKVETVVFAPANTITSNFTKAEKRAFMSHKSTKMLSEAAASSSADVKTSATIDPTEASNLNLDKALHSMLLTNLLPNAAEASRPSEKRNAISGRLMELASLALPGAGTSALSQTTLSSHPARVRTGILKAQASRAEAARAEAQAAGSWVKGAGGLGDGLRGSTPSSSKRGGGLGAGFSGGGGKNREKGMAGGKGVSRDRGEREKGLGMGIGRFEGGMLKLSKAEIERGSARPERGRGRGRGKGGRGGRGGSRGGSGGGIRAKSTSH